MNVQILYAGALVLIAVTLALLYVLRVRAGSWKPTDAVHRVGYGLAFGVIACSIGVIVLGSRANFEISQHAIAGPDEILEMDLRQSVENFEFKLVDDNRPSTFESYKGKVVILNLWATWCAPCLMEIPDLNQIQREYEDQGVVVISISDEDRATLTEFERSLNLETVSGYFEITGKIPALLEAGFDIRPTSYIVDRDGVARKYILGARDYNYFKRAIEPYL
ncbi:MAG: TlpA family protein disulfide reductase [Rhodothermales bacterium]|nr:TlpA family protein disulfide reductase [Rhodothermales bacterium]